MRLMPCKHAGCKKYTSNRNRYCDMHQTDAQSGKRSANPEARKFYNGAEWQKIREDKLISTPLCEICSTDDHPIPANTVHHIDHDIYNNQAANLLATCFDCHEMKHGRKKPNEKYLNGKGV